MNKAPFANIIFPALEATAVAIGVEVLPQTIKDAKPELLNTCTLEVLSFVILYADKYEKGEAHQKGFSLATLIDEWRELTGSCVYQNVLYRAKNEFYHRAILGGKPFTSRKILGLTRGQYKKQKDTGCFAIQQRDRKAAIAAK